MSEKGKDKLFLAYANYSLRVDPKNFFKIFDVGDRRHSFLPIDKRSLRAQVEAIVECEYSKKAFVESVISKKPDPNVRVIYPDMDLMNSIEAVYGYRDGFCEHECPVRKIREDKWGREPFEGPDRWKCIECDQFDFGRVLLDIMDGIPYSEIDGLLPKPALEFALEMSSPHPVPERSDKKLEEYSPDTSRVPLLSSDEGSSKFGFRRYWNVLIGTDLEGFLNQDDNNWRRLKLCPYCNEFFIARDIKKKWCYSPDCEREYHKRVMQERRKRDG